jgi:hypothetical protein
MIRKPSISPFSERTLRAEQLAPAVDDERLVGAGLLVAHPHHQVGEEEQDGNQDHGQMQKRRTHGDTPHRAENIDQRGLQSLLRITVPSPSLFQPPVTVLPS